MLVSNQLELEFWNKLFSLHKVNIQGFSVVL